MPGKKLSKKASIIFLELPPSLKKNPGLFGLNQADYENTGFRIDQEILLPVELVNDEGNSDAVSLTGEMITREMLLTGMLRVISSTAGLNLLSSENRPKKIKSGDILKEPFSAVPPEWIEYYRHLIFAVKPDIFHEFSGAVIVKTANEEWDMALEINEVLEGLFPRSPGVLLNKALILGNKALAREENFRKANSREANSREANSRKASSHMAGARDAGDNVTALALLAYETVLSMEPVLPDAYFNAGYFFLGIHDFERAKECFSKYISLGKVEGEDPTELFLAPSLPAEKILEAEKIVRDISGQGLDDISFREAYNLINQGKDSEGLDKIRVFIEKHPKVRNGWFILGWALRKLGRYDDALEAFKKAIELGGTDTDTQNEIAICYMELGDLKSAQKNLEAALRKDPESIKIISNLGVIALKNGKKEEAEAFFRTVLELDPGDPLALHYLSL